MKTIKTVSVLISLATFLLFSNFVTAQTTKEKDKDKKTQTIEAEPSSTETETPSSVKTDKAAETPPAVETEPQPVEEAAPPAPPMNTRGISDPIPGAELFIEQEPFMESGTGKDPKKEKDDKNK